MLQLGEHMQLSIYVNIPIVWNLFYTLGKYFYTLGIIPPFPPPPPIPLSPAPHRTP